MIGGIIRWFVDKKKSNKEENSDANSGILFCSGMIAGEGLVGILLAIFAVFGIADKIDLSGAIDTGIIGGIVLMVVMVLCILKSALWSKDGK
jgi:hypothetical protein